MLESKKIRDIRGILILLFFISVLSCTKQEDSIKSDIVQSIGFRDKRGVFHCQGTLINGKKEGLWTEYNNDSLSSILSINEYKNGINTGIEISFYDNGNLCSVGFNKNGKEDGRWIIFQSSSFHKIASEEYYQDGIATGIWKQYDDHGFLRWDYDYKTKKIIKEYGLIHNKPVVVLSLP